MIERIKRFIANGKTEKAFDLIQKELIGLDFLENNVVLLLQSRFNENEISYRNQLIDINEYLLEKTKVKSTLLQFVIPQLEEFLDSIEYKFEKLLNGNAEDIINFLFNNKKIFNILIGTSDSLEINFVSILNEDIKNCFIVGRKMLSSSVIGHWQILSFSQANDSGSGEYLRNELVKVSIALQQLQKSLYFTTNHVLEKYNVKHFNAIVVGGRRSFIDADFLKNENENLIGVQIRTYDWILNAIKQNL